VRLTMPPTITHILCHALFPCTHCGQACEKLTRASVVGGLIGEAERPAEVVCGDCIRAANKRPKRHKLRLAKN
jgi:hypothetical protein